MDIDRSLLGDSMVSKADSVGASFLAGGGQLGQAAAAAHDAAFIDAALPVCPPDAESSDGEEGDAVLATGREAGDATSLASLRAAAAAAQRSTVASEGTPPSQLAPLHHMLANEGRLWALVSHLAVYDFGRAVTPARSEPLPADAAAHHSREAELALASHAELQLLHAVVAWGHSTHTARIVLPSTAVSGKGDSAASVAAANARAWQGGAGGIADVFAFLGPEAVLETTDGRSGELVAPALTPGAWPATHKAGGGGGDGHGGSCRGDADAPRLTLHQQDQAGEVDLLRSVWHLLRAGHPRYARLLCQLYGQSWRAATLLGPEAPVDTHVDGVRDPTLVATLGFLPSEAAPQPAIVDFVRRGNPGMAAWRAIARRFAASRAGEALGDAGDGVVRDGAALEAAVYALLSGDTGTLLRLPQAVGSWWDGLWVAAHTTLTNAVQHHMQGYAERCEGAVQGGVTDDSGAATGTRPATDVESLLATVEREAAKRAAASAAAEQGASRAGPTSLALTGGGSLSASGLLSPVGSAAPAGAVSGGWVDGDTAWTAVAASLLRCAQDPGTVGSVLATLVTATTQASLARTVAAAVAAGGQGADPDASASVSQGALASTLSRVRASLFGSTQLQGSVSAAGAASSAVGAAVVPLLRCAALLVTHLRRHGAASALPSPSDAWAPGAGHRLGPACRRGPPSLAPDALAAAPAVWRNGDVVLGRYVVHLARTEQDEAMVRVAAQLHHAAGVPLLAHALVGRVLVPPSAAHSSAPLGAEVVDPVAAVPGALRLIQCLLLHTPLWARAVCRVAAAHLLAIGRAEQAGGEVDSAYAPAPVVAVGVLPQHWRVCQAVALGMAAGRSRTRLAVAETLCLAPPGWEFVLDAVAVANAGSRWLAMQAAQPGTGVRVGAFQSAAAACQLLWQGLGQAAVGGASGPLRTAMTRGGQGVPDAVGASKRQLLGRVGSGVPALVPPAAAEAVRDGLEGGSEAEVEGPSAPLRGTGGVLAVLEEAQAWGAWGVFLSALQDWQVVRCSLLPQPAPGSHVRVLLDAAAATASAMQGSLQALGTAVGALSDPRAVWLAGCEEGATVLLEGDPHPPRAGLEAGMTGVRVETLAATGVPEQHAAATAEWSAACVPCLDQVQAATLPFAVSRLQGALVSSARWVVGAEWPAGVWRAPPTTRGTAVALQRQGLPLAAAWAGQAVDTLAACAGRVSGEAAWADAAAAAQAALSLLSTLPVGVEVTQPEDEGAVAPGSATPARQPPVLPGELSFASSPGMSPGLGMDASAEDADLIAEMLQG